jgi:KDO2-lipid IV(A) lauroyltransferase
VHVKTLRHNLSVATGAPAPEPLVRAALASYLRNFYEVLALPGWGLEQVVARVTTSGEATLRTAFATRGAVVPLPHSANWDLAGAWACQTGMPVTTVAEQLADDAFGDFLTFREGLGMQVLSHQDANTISALAGAVRQGRLVCLVADRDLRGSGVQVRWGSQLVTMPAGPAVVARRTGAALIPAVCSFTPDGMLITFGDVVQKRPGRDGLQAMTQDVADFFADQIARRPQDWHMMQPFFDPGEVR